MTFSVPEPDEEIEYFEFTVPGSKKKHKAPLLAYLPMGVAEAFESGGATIAAMASIFEDEATAKAVRQLRGKQFSALIKAWGEASGITLGESTASSDS